MHVCDGELYCQLSFFILLRHGFILKLRKVWNLLCAPGSPLTCDSPLKPGKCQNYRHESSHTLGLKYFTGAGERAQEHLLYNHKHGSSDPRVHVRAKYGPTNVCNPSTETGGLRGLVGHAGRQPGYKKPRTPGPERWLSHRMLRLTTKTRVLGTTRGPASK